MPAKAKCQQKQSGPTIALGGQHGLDEQVAIRYKMEKGGEENPLRYHQIK